MDVLPSPNRNSSRRFFIGVALLVLSLLFAACGGGDDAAPNPTVIPTEVATTTPLGAQGTPIPTAESTLTNTSTLVLWWPESLAPADLPDVTDLLNEQIGDFGQSEELPVDIEFRLKRYQDVGGILSTLQTAGSVAPGALPDLTLIRREDLAAAVQSGLIYPLEGFISSAIIGDLYDSALELGQIEGQIYGLPYTLDMLQLAYRIPSESELDADPFSNWTFEAILAAEIPLVFPAGRVNGISNTVYLQYLDAGGTPPTADGTIHLNQEALLTVLTFYEQATALGLIDERVLNYASVTDYQSALASGEINLAVIDSSMYLELNADGAGLLPGQIPTASGQPVSIVNGWMWVMTTGNADQQALASRFLSWMMNINSQREYSEAVHMLPSQRSALQNMDTDMVDVTLIDSILTNAIIPLPDNAGGTLARAMQNALNAVLAGESTAEDAVQAVVDQAED